MFDVVSQIKKFENWNMHSHFLVAKQIIENFDADNISFVSPERLWDAGSEGAKTGPAPPVRDYYSLFKINELDPLERIKVKQIQDDAFSKYPKYSEMIK